MLAATVLPAGTNSATQPFQSVGALPYQLMNIFNVILGYIHHSQVPSPLSSTAVHRTSQKRQRRRKLPSRISGKTTYKPVLVCSHPSSELCSRPVPFRVVCGPRVQELSLASDEISKQSDSKCLETYGKFDIAVTAKPVVGGLLC